MGIEEKSFGRGPVLRNRLEILRLGRIDVMEKGQDSGPQ